MAEAIVTGVVPGVVPGVVMGAPAQAIGADDGPASTAGSVSNATSCARHMALDVASIFIDSFRYAEPFRVARRPGSQRLEVAEGGMHVLDRPAGRPAQWRGACGCKSLKGHGLMSRTKFAAWLTAADGQAGGYLR